MIYKTLRLIMTAALPLVLLKVASAAVDVRETGILVESSYPLGASTLLKTSRSCCCPCLAFGKQMVIEAGPAALYRLLEFSRY